MRDVVVTLFHWALDARFGIATAYSCDESLEQNTSEWWHLRFLAYVQFSLKNLNHAYFDDDVCICTLL